MQLLLPIIAVLVIAGVGITKPEVEHLSETLSSSPTPSVNRVNTSTPTPTAQLLPSPKTGYSITPTQTIHTQQSSSDLKYPSATVVDAGNPLRLTSNDNTDTITDWYKDKISEKDMNAKSFVTTNSNGNVENVLVGANASSEIRVTILKRNDQENTTITVDSN